MADISIKSIDILSTFEYDYRHSYILSTLWGLLDAWKTYSLAFQTNEFWKKEIRSISCVTRYRQFIVLHHP